MDLFYNKPIFDEPLAPELYDFYGVPAELSAGSTADLSIPSQPGGGLNDRDRPAILVPEQDVQCGHRSEPLRLCGHSSDTGANPLTVLSFQPKRVDDLWTQGEWTTICEHLHNDNGVFSFVMGFRDQDGCKKYVKSKNVPVDRAISWSWSSISRTPRTRLAFVPYSTNERQRSRWGGMDFDAHEEGQAGRARELALAAFRVFLNVPGLALILETSGSGGWHVWAISPNFHDNREWIQLLKSVASTIGTVIGDGVCEIFPPDSRPSRFGKGMRAPGCWNPRTDACSEIVWENCRSSLGSVLSGKSKKAALNCNGLQGEFPDIEKNSSFFGSLYCEMELLRKFGITAAGTRNGKLGDLVGHVFHQVGREVAHRLAAAQFRGKAVVTNADETEHLASFAVLWKGLMEPWSATLSTEEREIFMRLDTENERDTFRILRSYARKAEQDGVADFPIARDNLAERLGITGKGAAGIRDKLAKLGAIAKTADYIPNKFAARFRWVPSANAPPPTVSC